MSSLAQRLAQVRNSRFVGRQSETALFRAALQAELLPYVVLHVSGPGGIGKTTLLHEFVRLSKISNALPVYLDCRNIEATPANFLLAVTAALGHPEETDALRILAQLDERVVLLFDTYERLIALDSWLRDKFLPHCPADMLTVFASRNPPTLPWRTDGGWQELMRHVALRNLSPDESRALLEKKSLPLEKIEAILNFTHGFPLALSLALEQLELDPDNEFLPSDSPKVINALLEKLLDHVPSLAHRKALEICALARVTTENLLQKMTDAQSGPTLFSWLRDLSFIESDAQGLFPHDLARDAILTELRWRNPSDYGELHRRARDYYMLRLEETTALEQQRVLFDYIFLHRDNPIVRPYFDWQDAGVMADAVQADELPQLIAMVEKHEGQDSATLAAYWLEQQPAGITVYRDGQGHIQGFLFMLALEQLQQDQIKQDPATEMVWQTLKRDTQLRAGEKATLFRFWMSRDQYQAVSSVQSSIFLSMVQHYLTTPGLAYTFIPTAESEFWSPIFSHVDIHRLENADFNVGSHSFGLYGHDWRIVPPYAWLALMAEREIAITSTDSPPPDSVPLLVLSEAEFNAALRQALRDFARDDLLLHNPLLHSRLVQANENATLSNPQAIARLRQVILEIASGLQRTPRLAKFYEPLLQTYLKPAGTQEEIAEKLDLPFGTYRRYLKSALDYTLSTLWQKELGH